MNKYCSQSGIRFEISKADLSFYEQVSPVIAGVRYNIPPPSLCPEVRERRRLAFRNERTLYRRKCDYSGKPIVSTYAPEAPFPVYASHIWHSDAWDPLSYGRPFDFERPFFEQFEELMQVVPMFSLHHQSDNENCDYTNLVTRNKNCYYIFAAAENEDCMYTTYLHRCRDSADCFFVFGCELCYECIDCYNCYQLQHSMECENCSDSQHLLNCKGCSNCFGCISLANKTYCIFNKQYSKDDYHSIIQDICSRPDKTAFIEECLSILSQRIPRKYYAGMNAQDSSGDHLANCRNANYCFDCTDLEDCTYCTWLHNSKNCYDCYAWGQSGELGLENHLCGNNFYHVLFSEQCWNNVSELIYCRGCYGGCSQLFGCIGLHNEQYCILNTRYSKTECERIVPKMINHMQKTGEWGEFFPESLSPYGYNETVAAEYYPLNREQVIKSGWKWREQQLPGIYDKQTLCYEDIPADIQQIDESICSEVLCCRESHKNFRISKAELNLYKKLNVPVPALCFDSRYTNRLHKRNQRKLFKRSCNNCRQSLLSSYPQEHKANILCEPCYQDFVLA